MFEARQLALKQMSVDPQLPEAAPLALPFDQEGSDQTKPEVEDKPRLLKVTVDRIIRFGPTPGCANCKVWSGKVHTPECRARIDSLVRAEQDAAWKRKKEELAAKKSANLEDEALDDEVEMMILEIIDEIEENDDIKVSEYVELDEDFDFGISLEAALYVAALEEEVIEKFISDFNSNSLKLDSSLYSFKTEEE
jgi:hypothetical protein